MQLSLNLAAGWGPGGRGPNRCPAATGPLGDSGAGEMGTGCRPGLGRGGAAQRRIQTDGPTCAALDSHADLKLMFDPHRDLCLKLAATVLPGQSKLGLGSGRAWAHPEREERRA